MSSDLVAEALIGLDVDLPGAAELVEVVDVERAQVDLQRVEDVADLHAHRHALGAVDVEVQPGRVRPGAVEQALQARRVSLPRSTIWSLTRCKLVQAEIAAVLDDELEIRRSCPGRRSAGRRRADTTAPRYFPPAVARGSRRRSRRRTARAAPLVEIFEHHVHRAEVGRIGAQDQRLTGDAHGMPHARRFEDERSRYGP